MCQQVKLGADVLIAGKIILCRLHKIIFRLRGYREHQDFMQVA